MRILHISDLHLTPPFRSLDDIWNGPLPILEQAGPFDFIIVSGDLSQHAEKAEYDRLAAFTRANLMPHLKRKTEAARVVFVPGNHDVSWSADIGDSISIAQYLRDGKRPPAELMRRLQQQDDSEVRQTLTDLGHLDLLRIDWQRYPSRFANVQQFLTDFYSDLPDNRRFRPFNLLSLDEGDHWSAHVFPEDKVAFYGFNSCSRNDKYWHGAGLGSSSVLRARTHADRNAKDMLRIAVWHHGLVSERSRPDRLMLQDVGLLHNANFRIGFHGHTHKAEVELLDQFLAERFVVISTGSLGAGADSRPDAVGNQFSIVHLFPGQLDVQTFERDHLGIFRAKGQRLLLLSQDAVRPSQRSRAKEHKRICLIDEQGITTVAVELKEVLVHGHITLAVVTPPFCNVAGDPDAETSEGRRPVVRENMADGRVRFTLAGTELMKRVSWNYRISNSHALHQGDLLLMDRRPASRFALREHEECRTDTVYFPCDWFEYLISFAQKTSGIVQHSARCIVERWDSVGGQEQWRSIENERQRCTVESQTTHSVKLTVEAPIVEHRYTIAYKLVRKEEGELDPEGSELAEYVVTRCRSERLPWARLSAELSTALDEGLHDALEGELGPKAEWLGLLWSPSQKRLLTAFGHFSPDRWKARFAAGAGLAGHAFRFATDAAWHRETLESSKQTNFAVIFQKARSHLGLHHEYPYEWIVCIPILTPKHAAIGVVSFSGFENSTDTDRRLATYARRVNEGKLRVRSDDLRDNLITAVNAAFWTAIAISDEITDPEMRRYAKDAAVAFSER
jgi:predicted MPP superfamily phosphohydrolase